MIAKSLALRVGCHTSENVLPEGRRLEEIIGEEFPRRTFKAG
jgi:CRP-like cAMP-binding protein